MRPSPRITPNLWFEAEALPAAELYVSVFPRSEITGVLRPADEVVTVGFVLDGQPFTSINGRTGPGFTDATSLHIRCADQAEVDHYWSCLTDGGEEGRCGWLKDRYGVSWQVVPDELGELLGDPDPGRAQRATQAMLTMTKLDVVVLRAAADG